MNGAYKVTTIAGIQIYVHYTWLFAFIFITWTLAASWFPSDYPDWSKPAYFATAIVASLLLFGSIVVHELAHSLVALGRGMRVRSITLFIFGGVSDIGGDTKSPRDEFQIAIVGPLSNLCLSILGGLALSMGVGMVDSPVYAILVYFTLMNLLVGVFNLLPGFPLDGGRVLRSIVWVTTKDDDRATGVSTAVGIGFGWLLVGAGVFMAITSDVISGLWLGFIGWYLKNSAASIRTAYRRNER